MIVLGLNAFHADSSAALIRDGDLIAAVEEERFNRIKHWAGFPVQSIQFVLRQAGIGIADVDAVAINQNSRANFAGRASYVLRQRPNLSLLLERIRNRAARANVEDEIDRNFPGWRGRLHRVDHHLAHMSSAFHVSPFERACVLSIDGFGDFSSAAWGIGNGTDIKIEGRVNFPHSLGIFYQGITQYLGFPRYGDEYKVMGLAPYGTPALLPQLRQLVRLQADGRYALDLTYFVHHEKPIAEHWTGAPSFRDLFSPTLEQLLGSRRAPGDALTQHHRDIAYAAQAVYEEAFFHLLNAIQQRSGLVDLALAGGCAMNSVAAGKIRQRTNFRRVYVAAAAGDAGGAIGAAFATWHASGGARSFTMENAYWGNLYDAADIDHAVAARREDLAQAKCCVTSNLAEAQLKERVAAAIADGKVVGWFQGKMEWGPRALGNRSILADPRRADMKDVINAKIKRRESFRPFAPAVLEEAADHWFEHAASVPFMTEVLPIRAGKRSEIPAVCHVDGTGRLQTVSRRSNPRFHTLIEAFAARSGVPMLLNTSFNENEPIVRTPSEALDCFLRTEMDVLVLGETLIERS